MDNNIPEIARRQIEHIADVCERIKPLLVINCITYNHEPFLRDALEGFVMQKTNFPFVAIVHEDASTDGTAAVLSEYAERYPDIILPIFEKENQYSKHDGSLGRIRKAAKAVTNAKYTAVCEGDDYWTYEYKLQKQVDFLESHPDYSFVFHNAPIKKIDGKFDYTFFGINGMREYSASEILKQWPMPTASIVYRRENVDEDPALFSTKFKYGDNVLFLTAAKYGRLYGMDEYWSVYRKHEGSIMSSVESIRWFELDIEHFKELDKTFSLILEKNLCKKIIANNYIYIIQRHRTISWKLVVYVLRALKDVPFQFISKVFNFCIKKF